MWVRFSVLAMGSIFGVAFAQAPAGWMLRGSDPSGYEASVDRAVHRTGQSSALYRAKNPAPNQFGTLMQSIKADDYRGKRVRLRGHVKTENVERVQLWMRLDSSSMRMLGFDNMNARPIEGTTDWTAYDLVLDVPADAAGIAYGVLMAGLGQLWLDDVSLEMVDSSVATTGISAEDLDHSNKAMETRINEGSVPKPKPSYYADKPRQPTNTGFEL